MPLNPLQLQELLEVAKLATQKAGMYIEAQREHSIETLKKSAGESLASQVVTEVDLQAEKIIIEILSPTLDQYKLGLLSEESVDDGSRFEHDYFWCIDPLDGTLAFSQKRWGFSTSVALVSREGIPFIGVVYNPQTSSLYYAQRGSGAFKDGLALKVKDKSDTLTLLYSKSYLDDPLCRREIQDLEKRAFEQGFKEITHPALAGAVVNALSTIEDGSSLYYKRPKKTLGGGSLWDFAATSVIHSEAGGFNRDYFGNALDLNSPDSTFMNRLGVVYASHESLFEFMPNR